MTKKTEKKLNKKDRLEYLWAALLFCFLLFVDQITKAWADAYFESGEQVTVIPGWIYLCITYNQGIAYGIGKDAPTWLKIGVIIATAVMMLVMAIAYFKVDKNKKLIRIAIICIVAGGVGNLIDRVYYQVWDENALYGVRDMVDLNAFGFAVCNFADFFISGGAVALIAAFLFFDKEAIFPLGKYKEMAKAENEAESSEESEGNGQDKNTRLPKIE